MSENVSALHWSSCQNPWCGCTDQAELQLHWATASETHWSRCNFNVRSADIINTSLCLSFLNENEYTIRHKEKMMAAICISFFSWIYLLQFSTKNIHTCTKHKTIIYSANCVMNAFMMQIQRWALSVYSLIIMGVIHFLMCKALLVSGVTIRLRLPSNAATGCINTELDSVQFPQLILQRLIQLYL